MPLQQSIFDASSARCSGCDDVIDAKPGLGITQALLNERHGLIAWTSINNPVIMHKLMTSKLGDEPVPDTQPPSPEFWRRILVQQNLKPLKP